MTDQTVLVLGASGRVGGHAVRAFAAAGWVVRRFDRARDSLPEAAQGADVIVVGAHPPTYDLWQDQLIPIHADAIAAAEETGATLIVPGNLYSFGPGAPAPWGGDSPQTATNPLAVLRQKVERMYRASSARTIFLYLGDFIDDAPSGNWFDRFITPAVGKGRIAWPGDPDVPHAWSFLPDVARIMVGLAERRQELLPFQPVAVPGLTLSGRDMGAALERVTGQAIRVGAFPWWQLQLLRPVMPILRGVFEMRYLWSLPHWLEGDTLARLLPEFRPTPVEEALTAALAHRLTLARAA